MRRSSRQMLSTSTALVGGLLMSFALPAAAHAQDAVPAAGSATVAPGADVGTPGVEGSDTGDIVVTARKRAEDIQSVPISITAYTAQDLAARNISNFNDLANSTPGVAITSISGGNVRNIYLRGLAPGNTANDLNVEANVGVHRRHLPDEPQHARHDLRPRRRPDRDRQGAAPRRRPAARRTPPMSLPPTASSCPTRSTSRAPACRSPSACRKSTSAKAAGSG